MTPTGVDSFFVFIIPKCRYLNGPSGAGELDGTGNAPS
jgi:hypothetical protein